MWYQLKRSVNFWKKSIDNRLPQTHKSFKWSWNRLRHLKQNKKTVN